MNKQTVKKLVELTANFYSINSQEFDLKNKHFREGWKNIKFNDYSKVLDIAAGNYRLFEYLSSLNFGGSYSALENSKDFVNYYKQNFLNSFKLFNIDAVSDLEKVENKYDLITCFGFTHHLPSLKLRVKWFNQVGKLLSNNGKFIFTTWNFNTLSTFNKAKRQLEGVFEEGDLEDGDYFLGWDNGSASRYCHLYSNKEVSFILSEAGFKPDSSFEADGKNNKSNTYYVVSHR
ncbi:class I SAM-dependent methyltransferase [bacterium]|nr:class I SAM-dependent methyltransferase [bacterium]